MSEINKKIFCLYYSCAMAIMDMVYTEIYPYINHKYIDTLPLNIYSVNDCYFAAYDYICKKYLSDSKNDVYIIMSPFHSIDVIWGLYIPLNNKITINNMCKDIHLYTLQNTYKYSKSVHLSHDLYTKTQQKS